MATARAAALSPEFQAGCPQQDWLSGTITSHPAASSNVNAAMPALGRMASIKQVTNNPTLGFLRDDRAEEDMAKKTGPLLLDGFGFNQQPGRIGGRDITLKSPAIDKIFHRLSIAIKHRAVSGFQQPLLL